MMYLKTWTIPYGGTIQIEPKMASINSLEELVSSFDVNAVYYSVKKVDVTDVVRAVKELGETK